MKLFNLCLFITLASAANGNGWCNQPAFQKYTISSPLLFSCDDSDLKNDVSALTSEIAQLREQIRLLISLQPPTLPATSIRPTTLSATAIPLTTGLSNTAVNCDEILQQDSTAATGVYSLSTEGRIVNVICDFDVQLPPTSPVRGWQEVANIDLSDSTNLCPAPMRESTNVNVSRRCEKSSFFAGCESVLFPTNRVPFSKLCGRVRGYSSLTVDALQAIYGSCRGFACETINDAYVDGMSITYGYYRIHIWTLAAHNAVNMYGGFCPCGNTSTDPVDQPPAFVGDNYYCEEAVNASTPLWDGVGCGDVHPGDAPCCENPNLPWFCREYDSPIVTDNIEVRLCRDEDRSNEDVSFDLLKIYIQ